MENEALLIVLGTAVSQLCKRSPDKRTAGLLYSPEYYQTWPLNTVIFVRIVISNINCNSKYREKYQSQKVECAQAY